MSRLQGINQFVGLHRYASGLIERRSEITGDITAAQRHIAAAIAIALHDQDIQSAVRIGKLRVRLSRQGSHQSAGAAAYDQYVHVHILSLGILAVVRLGPV